MHKLKSFLLTIITLVVITCGAMATNVSAAPRAISACQTINASGSYILTQNLMAEDDCLILTVNNITIDLDGFTIAQPPRATGFAATGSAITVPGSGGEIENITIRNGMILGFQFGINFDVNNTRRIRVERMTITGTTLIGVRAGKESIIRDNIIADNVTGISTGLNSLIVGNTCSGSRNAGISVRQGSSVIGNVASRNSGFGIDGQNGMSDGMSYIHNTASYNGKSGIRAHCPSNLVGNTAYKNEQFDFEFSSGGCPDNHNVAPSISQ